MRPFLLLRILAYLKRSSRALESIAESQRMIAAQYRQAKSPRMTEIFTASIEERDDAWAAVRMGYELPKEGEL